MSEKEAIPLPELQHDRLNLAVVDLETASLSSHRFVVCVGIKPLDGDPYYIGIDNVKRCKDKHRIDTEVVREAKRHLEHYDGWVWWNGDRFDKPFLNDRLQMCGLEMLEQRFQWDLMKDFKWPKSRTASISLKNVSGQFGCPYRKVEMNILDHEKARNEAIVMSATDKWLLGKEYYQMLVDHCVEDLKMTQWMISIAKPRKRILSKNCA